MGCQKYQSWITDEALGALAENRERELLSHATECAACSTDLNRVRLLYRAIDCGLANTVSAEPSPELTVRVRRRIAEAPAPAHERFVVFFPAVAGALVLAAVLLALWLRPHPPRQPGAATQSHEIAITGNIPSQMVAEIGRPPVELPRHSGEEPALANRSAGRAPSPAFEVLVPPGELQAVVQFAAALNGTGVVRAQLKTNMEETRNPLEVKSLDFPALEVTKLEDAQSASESGSR